MEYDEAGNMVFQADFEKNKKKRMDYDSFNRITRVTDPDTGRSLGEYSYDHQGFRVKKLALRSIDGADRQVEVLYPSMYFGVEKQKTLAGQDIPETEYGVNNVYLNGVRIAAVVHSTEARYYLTDQVDSVKVVVDDHGQALTRYEYLPYGETWFEEGEDNHNPKYNSQELDKETGYYFYNARYYDPEIARFVTADNVVDGDLDTQGWNRFSYVKGNPIRYKDPTGHWKERSLVYDSYDNKGVQRIKLIIGGVVDKGDDLYTIAEKQVEREIGDTSKVTKKLIYNRINEIKTVNGLKSNVLHEGQHLITGEEDRICNEKGLEDTIAPWEGVGLVKAGFSIGKIGYNAIKNRKTIFNTSKQIFKSVTKKTNTQNVIKQIPDKLKNKYNPDDLYETFTIHKKTGEKISTGELKYKDINYGAIIHQSDKPKIYKGAVFEDTMEVDRAIGDLMNRDVK